MGLIHFTWNKIESLSYCIRHSKFEKKNWLYIHGPQPKNYYCIRPRDIISWILRLIKSSKNYSVDHIQNESRWLRSDSLKSVDSFSGYHPTKNYYRSSWFSHLDLLVWLWVLILYLYRLRYWIHKFKSIKQCMWSIQILYAYHCTEARADICGLYLSIECIQWGTCSVVPLSITLLITNIIKQKGSVW